MTTYRVLARYLTVAALMAAAACSDAPDPTGPSANGDGPSLHRGSAAGAFTVYSQNVYLGGDTGPLLSLAP